MTRAERIHRDAIVIDMHNDLPSRIIDDGYDPDVRHRPGVASDEGETDLPRLMDSGITAVFLAAFVHGRHARARPDRSWARVQLSLDAIHDFVNRHPAELLLATSAADACRAKAEGRVAIFVGVEGGHAIESSLDHLRELRRRGATYMTLTWNNGNEWAGSSIGERDTPTGGLTAFGRDVVREMNRLGMLVDISHVSDQTFDDVVATSTAPVIASHSSARALNPHPRNLTDDQLRAVARTGGVVNVTFYAAFLDPAFLAAQARVEREINTEFASRLAVATAPAEIEALHDEMETRGRAIVQRLPAPPLSVLVDHIDHVARVAGIDHVGLGSDFDGVGGLLPAGMRDVADVPNLVPPLLDRGYTEADVMSILGGNMLRVLDAATR